MGGGEGFGEVNCSKFKISMSHNENNMYLCLLCILCFTENNAVLSWSHTMVYDLSGIFHIKQLFSSDLNLKIISEGNGNT